MDLCSSGHDEVCYETRTCPMCDIINEMQDELKEAKKEIDRLNDALAEERG